MSARGVRVSAAALSLAAAALAPPLACGAPTSSARERFRSANELARSGDYPKAIAVYGAIAGAGHESASLYWNWAQSASARGAQGEALWALLRARELDPGDRAVRREVDRMREALNLDPAEIAPEPLAAAARSARRFHLELVALGLIALSLFAHAVARVRPGARATRRVAAGLLAAGALAAALPIAGSLARHTAAVVQRGAPLFEAASPAADASGSLREGEVVPVLEASGEWLRVESNAGARGWARAGDLRPLEKAPSLGD